ncbi:hypothetical protein HWV62_22463 [Athelia sp. TMB]|nr:hypothetical protein HWV62_22463 [Athelia sp. TMB]
MPSTNENTSNQPPNRHNSANEASTTATVTSVMATGLRLVLAILQLGLRLGLFTVSMASDMIPAEDIENNPTIAEPLPLPSTGALEHSDQNPVDTQLPSQPGLLPAMQVEQRPPTPPATPSPPTTPAPSSPASPTLSDTSTLPPPYEEFPERERAAHRVDTDEHGWTEEELSMDGLVITEEEARELMTEGVGLPDEGGESEGEQSDGALSSSSNDNRRAWVEQNGLPPPPAHTLHIVRVPQDMELVSPTRTGAIYRTDDVLWECHTPSNSASWYAVVKGRKVGVFKNWQVHTAHIQSRY